MLSNLFEPHSMPQRCGIDIDGAACIKHPYASGRNISALSELLLDVFSRMDSSGRNLSNLIPTCNGIAIETRRCAGLSKPMCLYWHQDGLLQTVL